MSRGTLGSSLDPTFKMAWLDALRSGAYQQGRSVLKRTRGGEDTFCCLGVAGNILPVAKWEKQGGLWYIQDPESGPSSFVVLPVGLRDRIGLDGGTQSLLSRMNDEERKSFVEIADWIEGNL